MYRFNALKVFLLCLNLLNLLNNQDKKKKKMETGYIKGGKVVSSVCNDESVCLL